MMSHKIQIINDQYVPSKSKWRKLENALIFINKSKVASKVKCQNIRFSKAGPLTNGCTV